MFANRTTASGMRTRVVTRQATAAEVKAWSFSWDCGMRYRVQSSQQCSVETNQQPPNHATKTPEQERTRRMIRSPKDPDANVNPGVIHSKKQW